MAYGEYGVHFNSAWPTSTPQKSLFLSDDDDDVTCGFHRGLAFQIARLELTSTLLSTTKGKAVAVVPLGSIQIEQELVQGSKPSFSDSQRVEHVMCALALYLLPRRPYWSSKGLCSTYICRALLYPSTC